MPPKHHKPIKAKARRNAEADEDQDENSSTGISDGFELIPKLVQGKSHS